MTCHQHSTVPVFTASTVLHHLNGALPFNSGMRCIGEIRRLRLLRLKQELGLTFAEMSVRLGRSRRDATLSQIAQSAPNSRSGRPRQLGDDQARLLERTFEREVGWMDRDPLLDELEARLGGHHVHDSGLDLPYGWPLKRVRPRQLMDLTEAQRDAVEALILSMLPAEETAQLRNSA